MYIGLNNQGLELDIDIQTNPLMVIGKNVIQNPTLPDTLKEPAFSDVWWKVRTRNVSSASLGVGTLPGSPPLDSQILPDTAPFNTDCKAALNLNWDNRFDFKPNDFLGGFLCAWLEPLDIGSSSVTLTSITPSGSSIGIEVQTALGYTSAVAMAPVNTVIRYFFVTYQDIHDLISNSDQGVIKVNSDTNSLITHLRVNFLEKKVCAISINEIPPIPGWKTPRFEDMWWQAYSNMASFPSFTINNEHDPDYATHRINFGISQGIVRTSDFKQELFWDGPGWVVSGAPELNSLALMLLDNRGTDQEGSTFPADIELDSQPIASSEYLTYTSTSYSDIKNSTLSNICLRVLMIPAWILI